MKRNCYIGLIVWLCCLVVNFDVKANVSNDQCVPENPTKNPTDCTWKDVGCVKTQFCAEEYGVWSPIKGAILFTGNGDTTIFRYDELFQVFLYFQPEAISFFKENTWAGLEIDIKFPNVSNYVIPRINPSSVRGPEGTMPVRDTIIACSLEEKGTRGITIMNPSAMKEGWNSFSFSINDNIFLDLGDNVQMQADIQLVANVTDESFLQTLGKYNNSTWRAPQIMTWLSVESGGMFLYGDDVFKYFLMAKAGQATEEPLIISQVQ